MLSTRHHLAFASRPFNLITGRLGRQTSPAGCVPCKNRNAFERRFNFRKKTCLSLADFDDMGCSPRNREAITEILDMYETLDIAPVYLSKRDVIEMIDYKRNSWPEYFNYLFKQEGRHQFQKHECYHFHKHFRKKIPFLGQIFDDAGQLVYGPYNNTIFTITDTLKNVDPLRNLKRAAMFGQRLVFDFSYDELMRSKEQQNLASQIILSLSYNRQTKDPMDIWFASYSANRHFVHRFKLASGEKLPLEVMVSVENEPLEKLFPTEQVIYLSPHSPEVMTHFDPDAVYVIGALVDTYRTDRKETSYKRACRANLRSVRLPVLAEERNNEPPCLPVSSVAAMLIDMRNEGISVEEALNRHISIRKIRAPFRIYKAQMHRQMMHEMLKQQEMSMSTCN